MYRTLFLLIVWLCCMPILTYAHSDPPIMNLILTPDMPDVGEKAPLQIVMHGAITGIPVTGAKIKVEAIHLQTGEKWTVGVPEVGHGHYEAHLIFPEYDMWKLNVSIEHMNELDTREYNVHVMKPIPGYQHVLKDQTELAMDKNVWGQPIPPSEVLQWYVIVISWLLVVVYMIKRRQKSKEKWKRKASTL